MVVCLVGLRDPWSVPFWFVRSTSCLTVLAMHVFTSSLLSHESSVNRNTDHCNSYVGLGWRARKKKIPSIRPAISHQPSARSGIPLWPSSSAQPIQDPSPYSVFGVVFKEFLQLPPLGLDPPLKPQHLFLASKKARNKDRRSPSSLFPLFCSFVSFLFFSSS